MDGNSKETYLFEDQWGVTNAPEAGNEFSLLPSASTSIAAELESVNIDSAEICRTLINYSVQHAGLEILHLFMVDLLGRNTAAAKIFKEKFGEEFADSQVVLVAQKYAAGGLMFGLNAFFLYFVLLKGLEKGQAWQLQYVVCALIQVAIDLFIFETTECIWLNVVVPHTVQAEVVEAASILASTAEAAVDPPSVNTKDSPFLNAAAYLFVSARVARAYPQLLESLIVRSYSNHLPGQICKTWPHYQKASGTREIAVTRPTMLRSIFLVAAASAAESRETTQCASSDRRRRERCTARSAVHSAHTKEQRGCIFCNK
jgi:hypothetical protein